MNMDGLLWRYLHGPMRVVDQNDGLLRVSDRCLNCNERIEYFTDRVDGVDRWLHIIPGTPATVYQECRPLRTVAEPGSESEKDRVRAILTRKLHPRTDGFGIHPNFIDSIVDELFPEGRETDQ
jgi:hypothetical protein